MKPVRWISPIALACLAPGQSTGQSIAPGTHPPGGPDGIERVGPPVGPIGGGVSLIPPPYRPISRRRFVTWVTGEVPGADVIFEVVFDPRLAYSALVTIAVAEPRGIPLDGIDFVPGTLEVAVGSPAGVIPHYDLPPGAILPDFIADTDLIAVPPAGPGTWPSTVLSTPTHFYYVENQFGFGATPSHRIIRKPWPGGPEEVVYDGAVHGLSNFEGLEIVAGRLFFFAKDPGPPDKRALISIGLAGGGTWDGLPFELEIGALTEAPGPPTDGSDELDFDPSHGLIFGTNIIDGEVIAFDPFADLEVSSPGAVHFIDGVQVAASVGDLALLGGEVDGIRAIGNGYLVFTGKAGVMGSIRIAGVLADGADDGDLTPLVVMPGMLSFDDLTPVLPR